MSSFRDGYELGKLDAMIRNLKTSSRTDLKEFKKKANQIIDQCERIRKMLTTSQQAKAKALQALRELTDYLEKL